MLLKKVDTVSDHSPLRGLAPFEGTDFFSGLFTKINLFECISI